MSYIGKHQKPDNHIRMWSAKVTMALATVIRISGIKMNDQVTIQVMLSYLYLGSDMCKFVVSDMDKSVRLVLLMDNYMYIHVYNYR